MSAVASPIQTSPEAPLVMAGLTSPATMTLGGNRVDRLVSELPPPSVQLDFQVRLIAARQDGRMSDTDGQNEISELLHTRLDSIICEYTNASHGLEEDTKAAWHDWVTAAVKVRVPSSSTHAQRPTRPRRPQRARLSHGDGAHAPLTLRSLYLLRPPPTLRSRSACYTFSAPL